MEKIKTYAKKIINRKTFFEVFKYGIVTIISYIFIVALIFILTNYLGLGEKISYLIALTLAYVGIYISFNKFVFKTTHNKKMLVRFLIVLGLSWVANNLLFAFWIDILLIAYPIATALNTFVLGIFRFLAQKFYVRS